MTLLFGQNEWVLSVRLSYSYLSFYEFISKEQLIMINHIKRFKVKEGIEVRQQIIHFILHNS